MFLTISKLKEVGIISLDIKNYIIPIYFITLILLIFFGYLDVKIFKGFKKETQIMNEVTPLHPELADMKMKIDWLYKKY